MFTLFESSLQFECQFLQPLGCPVSCSLLFAKGMRNLERHALNPRPLKFESSQVLVSLASPGHTSQLDAIEEPAAHLPRVLDRLSLCSQ